MVKRPPVIYAVDEHEFRKIPQDWDSKVVTENPGATGQSERALSKQLPPSSPTLSSSSSLFVPPPLCRSLSSTQRVCAALYMLVSFLLLTPRTSCERWSASCFATASCSVRYVCYFIQERPFVSVSEEVRFVDQQAARFIHHHPRRRLRLYLPARPTPLYLSPKLRSKAPTS